MNPILNSHIPVISAGCKLDLLFIRKPVKAITMGIYAYGEEYQQRGSQSYGLNHKISQLLQKFIKRY